MTRRTRGRAPDVEEDVGPPGTWTCDAMCREADFDFFGKTRASWGASKALCASCPVRRQCLEYALDAKMLHGVWGGLDPLNLRFVLGREANGDVWTYAYTVVRCPFCRGRTDSVELSREAVSRKCVECGFEWTRAEHHRAKRVRRRPELTAVPDL